MKQVFHFPISDSHRSTIISPRLSIGLFEIDPITSSFDTNIVYVIDGDSMYFYNRMLRKAILSY